MKKFCIFIFSALFCLSCATDSFGVYHTVKKGENVTKISQLYKVDAKELRQENLIPEGVDELKEGSAIFIPGAAKVIETSPEPGTSTESASESGTSAEPDIENGTRINFIWPASGKIVRKFSPSAPKNNGIDLNFKQSTKIHAAAGGQVVFVGHRPSYGNMIVLSHPDEIFTIYAHLSTFTVKEGQTVKQNDVIGISDTTKTESVPALHFEIRKSSTPVDPVKYLPKN